MITLWLSNKLFRENEHNIVHDWWCLWIKIVHILIYCAQAIFVTDRQTMSHYGFIVTTYHLSDFDVICMKKVEQFKITWIIRLQSSNRQMRMLHTPSAVMLSFCVCVHVCVPHTQHINVYIYIYDRNSIFIFINTYAINMIPEHVGINHCYSF